MTEEILDIEKWKIQYPFLNDVSRIYDEFDQNVDDNSNNLYNVLCGQITNEYGGKISMRKYTCMKLLRNLGYITADPTYFTYNYDRCNILYNWIYNSKKKNKITDDIISNCYYGYIEAKKKINDNQKCIYYSYESDYKEPENIMLLNVFESYIEVARNTINSEDVVLKSSCHKYICEFVDIYKKMNSKYCLVDDPSDEKKKKTCEFLRSFKQKYDIFLFSELREKEKIPSLDDIDSVYMDKCKSAEHKPALPAVVHEEEPQYSHPRGSIQDGPYPFSSQPTDSNPDPKNSISSTVSTAVGTVAGASSLLALLYKFTPGRNWIRSGIRGSRGKINNNFYADVPSELLYDRMEHNDFNSYSIGYEAM